MGDQVRVLHVEDDPDFAELTEMALGGTDRRMDVVSVRNAADAEGVLERQSVDCIVSDYEMPGRNGIEFLRDVRDEYPDLPVILFTGKGSEEVASEAISAGVTDYLQKGGGQDQFEVLANRIDNAVSRHEAETELTRTNRLLSTLFDALPVGVLVEDESREVLAVNERHLELFGIDADTAEIVGRDATAIVEEVKSHFADPERFVTRTDELVADEIYARNEEHELADGRIFLRTHCPIELPEGSGYLWMYQDLTEQKEHERELAAREEALYRTYEVIADDGRSLAAQIEALLAIGRDVLGTDYATFSEIRGDRYEFKAVDLSERIDLQAGTTTDLSELPICEQVVTEEATLVHEDVATDAPHLVDDTWGISCYIGAPVTVDDDVYGTFCFYDTAARVEEFSEWERTFVDLLTDWVSSALSRAETHRQLERQNERLDEFASVVSHDLRTPLEVARGSLALAREDVDSEHLADVADAHDRMGALIDDLLTWAQTGVAITDTSTVRIADVARQCWRDLADGGGTLEVETESTVVADPERLRQLLENLLGNALEHGGEAVSVTIGDLPDGFYVADDGPGIPADERETVFESGYTSTESGTGFGLTIVEEIAGAHGWEVTATESADGGARFEVTGLDRVPPDDRKSGIAE
jgi:signal transduction histidine kinase/CheY-like chemotaxis protein